VIGSLPIALREHSIDVRVVIPFYKPLKDFYAKNTNFNVEQKLEFQLKYGLDVLNIKLHETKLPNTDISVYLIENPDYISNGGIYFSPETMSSPDNELIRFAIFSKAICQIFGMPNDIFFPDIIHCNDWHTGLVPQILQNNAHLSFSREKVKTIFTIHNLAYQGFSKLDVAEKLNLNLEFDQTLKWDAQDDNLDFLLQGVVGADYVTTVSERYATEIQQPEYGEGLHEILQARQSRLIGILNGISYDVFNPATDNFIPNKYSITDWHDKKELNKTTLQAKLGLEQNKDKPLIGIVSRLAQQKGLDLVVDSLSDILGLGVQLVILGTGDPQIESKIDGYNTDESKNKNFKGILKFSEEMARMIYAGSDMFLIPSRYEPSGLTQMIAMKYGSLPIVRSTGGLYDTVNNEVNGFTFDNLNETELLDIIKRACGFYINNKAMWSKMVAAAMQQDYSWKESAKKYVMVYYKALNS
ncbi:MAG: glycogen synthase, partial [Niabella sp.]